MKPSFTGSARPRRQVNLSGRNSNPFATHHPSNTSSPLPSHNAVANAQRERLQRQRERERPPAAVKIQKVWRGHRERATVRDCWRRQWDDNEAKDQGAGSIDFVRIEYEPMLKDATSRYGGEELFLTQLNLLVHFASPKRTDDFLRLIYFVSRFSHSYEWWHVGTSVRERWKTPLSLLARLLEAALMEERSLSKFGFYEEFLWLLSDLTNYIPDRVCPSAYYRAIAIAARSTLSAKPARQTIRSAIANPLSGPEPGRYGRMFYRGFVKEMLCIPDLQALIRVEELAINYNMLTSVLVENLSALPDNHDSMLWLLAYYIHFGRKRTNQQPNADYVKIVSTMISLLAREIEVRTASEASLRDDDGIPQQQAIPLPPFIEEQLSFLVNQESITSLPVHLQAMSTSSEENLESSRQTSALATYVLTLLRVFPRRGDDIRMWLFRGSATRTTKDRLPAIKFFFEASRSSEVYDLIKQDPYEVVNLLRSSPSTGARGSRMSMETRDRQWRIILIFMELYAFVLRFMDDEEFLSATDSSEGQDSWTRQSALSLEQVSDLTVFLKHLAFAMYWKTAEILGTEEAQHKDSISAYFSTKNDHVSSDHREDPNQKAEEAILAGMPGMTLIYLKGVVTGILRMVYERDSRRKFLPNGHWLMTKYFDMNEFVQAVVREEEEKQLIEESYERANEDERIMDRDREAVTLVGTSRTQRLREHQRLEELQFQRARQRYLASVTPRLEILQNMPFFIPFATRVHIFRQIIHMDQVKRRGGYEDPDDWRLNISRHRATVHRDSIFDDAFEQFFALGEGLKEPFQIKFVDNFGTEEEGIDGGGVTKEFLTSVTNETFNTTNGLDFFVENDQHLLYPNPSAVDQRRDFLVAAG